MCDQAVHTWKIIFYIFLLKPLYTVTFIIIFKAMWALSLYTQIKIPKISPKNYFQFLKLWKTRICYKDSQKSNEQTLLCLRIVAFIFNINKKCVSNTWIWCKSICYLIKIYSSSYKPASLSKFKKKSCSKVWTGLLSFFTFRGPS